MIVLIANSLSGAFSAAISGTYVEQPYTSCERTLSNEQAIQIVVYVEYAWPKGEHFFVLATQDVGKTWRQALYLRRDDPQFDNNTLCSNVEMLDEQTYWVWIDEQAAMTRDGGKTWRTLLKSDIKDLTTDGRPLSAVSGWLQVLHGSLVEVHQDLEPSRKPPKRGFDTAFSPLGQCGLSTAQVLYQDD